MIHGFFTTIQKDLEDMSAKRMPYKSVEHKNEQDKKLAFAVLRIFAALGMCVGMMVFTQPLLGVESGNALLRMGIGAAISTLCLIFFITIQHKGGYNNHARSQPSN